MNKKSLVLCIIIAAAAVLRFMNLMHDAPHFFNPDERNMAGAIALFRLPSQIAAIPGCLYAEITAHKSRIDPTTDCNLNPHFFSYGQFPLYLAYASDQTIKFIESRIPFLPTNPQQSTTISSYLSTDFPSAIFWLRFYSALSSVITVFLVFLIARQLTTYTVSLAATVFTAFTPGLIQAAHVGTTESLLTFFFFGSIYLSLTIYTNARDALPFKFFLHNVKFFILLSLCIGFALGSKLTGIFLLPAPFLVLLILFVKHIVGSTPMKVKCAWTGTLFFTGALMTLGSVAVGLVSSFYNLLEYENFKSAVFGYEADVATGRYKVFYAQQFVNTTPILFQLEKVFPYALGWPTLLLGLGGVVGVGWYLKHAKRLHLLILVVPSLLYFFPHALLYAKWTRFMTPMFPVFAIFASLVISRFPQYWKTFLLVLAILPGLAFMSIYTSEDSRVQATRWIYDNVPSGSNILFETANVVDIPLGGPQFVVPPDYNLTTISFDFYHLDENPSLLPQLLHYLADADYMFIPSRRIFANYYLRESKNFPLLARYYQLLFSGELGFEQVTEFASYPRLGPWVFPDENAEETFTVFDHPVVRIYKKVRPMEKRTYEFLLNVEP